MNPKVLGDTLCVRTFPFLFFPKSDFRDEAGTALHGICVVAFAIRPREVKCHHNCCDFPRSNLPLLSQRVGAGLRRFGCHFFPFFAFFFCFFLFYPPPFRPAQLSPRHSVGRRGKVTTRRPFLALYRSLKGNNGGKVRRKIGRISRKAEDKVPQNAGLAELCSGGGGGGVIGRVP